MFALRIEVRDLIDLLHLLAGLVGRDVRLVMGGFLGEVGRAGLAELARFVPADVRADPVSAARALMELGPDLVDRLLEGRVPLRAAQAVLHVLAGLARGPEAASAEQAAEALGELGADAEGARLERRAMAVAALVAEELELIAGVVAVVVIVPGERDRAHCRRRYIGSHGNIGAKYHPCAGVLACGTIAMMRGFLIGAVVVGSVAVAHGDPKPPDRVMRPAVPALVGATEVAKFSAPSGFIDDPIATDDTRLAYVLADASTKAELHVATIGGRGERSSTSRA